MTSSNGVPSGVRGNLALQREVYGELLGDRIRRVVATYGVSQARVAAVLGVSPTMLSQVMSGRRAKLANPAVLARLVLLERRSGGPGPREQVLEEVGALAAAEAVRVARTCDEATLVEGLGARFAVAELAACAAAVRTVSPAMAQLLGRVGN